METRPRKLLDQFRDHIRLKHYSYRTEQTYVYWIRRYILFHNKRHPSEMGATELEAFLTHLATVNNVAASTQNQALNAIVFLYRHVLKQDLGMDIDAVRAKRPKHLPTVLTPAEATDILQNLSGECQLVAKLLYGSGLRLNEALRLRIKDLDFNQKHIVVRDTKGGNNRITMLPISLIENLKLHLQYVKRLHQHDLDHGYGSVHLPFALARKYAGADRQWIWQFVFPSRRLSKDPRSGIARRHHLHESGLLELNVKLLQFSTISTLQRNTVALHNASVCFALSFDGYFQIFFRSTIICLCWHQYLRKIIYEAMIVHDCGILGLFDVIENLLHSIN